MAFSSATHTRAQSERTQYHHFIPRFILRHFTDKRRKDGMLNLIDLDSGVISRRALSRKFGLEDMYRDPLDKVEYDIEIKLSKLEHDTSRILAKAREAFGKPQAVLALSRDERNTLRTFLFLMKYRNRHMYGRFNCTSIDDYEADDKGQMRAYMETQGFFSPRDVWLANLRAFLDVSMDANREWHRQLQMRAYPDDAKLFILHAETTYIAFCKPPESLDEEFLLTENVFGIFEGPSSQAINSLTGEVQPIAYTEWHNFAPVSATLLLVLRSNFLPGGVADAGEPYRHLMYQQMKDIHLDPESASSVLQDLPIEKCTNSYARVVDGKMIPHHDRHGHGKEDKFFFKCFSLSSRHMRVINGIFLEECATTAELAFRSTSAARRAIECYLEDPTPGLKIIRSEDSPRLKCLRALRNALRHSDGSADLVYKDLRPPIPARLRHDFGGHFTRVVGYVVCQTLYKERPDLVDIHAKLRIGSYREDFFYGADQACRMLYFRVKTDVVLKRALVPGSKKEKVKGWRQNLFTSLPPQRVWLYLKIARNLDKFDDPNWLVPARSLVLEGAEDIVAHRIPDGQRPYLSYHMFYSALDPNGPNEGIR